MRHLDLERLLRCNSTLVRLEILKALASNPSHSLSLLSSRLAAGVPSRIRLIGGSITAGSGAAVNVPNGSVAGAFTYVFERALRSIWSEASLEIEVYAGGGLGSRYYGSCLEDFVPQNADLVVLDVSINDIEGSFGERGASFGAVINQLERLGVTAILAFNWAASPSRRQFGSSQHAQTWSCCYGQ
eukprot:Transcript_24121.p2 GENE.Transcript_24121~~Transcript_24121.p2  ORF type:complete len:186 (+),score=1.73 Transcript_24121:436-993(+)